MATKRKRYGITLTETIVASILLATALVPCMKALTAANTFTTTIERKTRALMLAREKMEYIRAKTIYSYATYYGTNSTSMGNSYFCSVTDTAAGSDIRRIKVCVGFDQDQNNSLSTSETLVTLESLIARRL